CRDHLMLPSFPTRRSSDLIHAINVYPDARILVEREIVLTDAADVCGEDRVGARERCAGIQCDVRRDVAELRDVADAARLEHFGRSEEHTSELQSRENLVCR